VTDPAAVRVRPTNDVDVICDVATLSAYERFAGRLRRIGFREVEVLYRDAVDVPGRGDEITIDPRLLERGMGEQDQHGHAGHHLSGRGARPGPSGLRSAPRMKSVMAYDYRGVEPLRTRGTGTATAAHARAPARRRPDTGEQLVSGFQPATSPSCRPVAVWGGKMPFRQRGTPAPTLGSPSMTGNMPLYGCPTSPMGSWGLRVPESRPVGPGLPR
jgi:hypothetical protein